MRDTLKDSLKHKASGTTGKGLGRAQEILEAARGILADEGYAGMSMRAVAARIGVSLSTVQHYYRSKDALVEAVLLYTLDMYQLAIDQLTEAMASATPKERFVAAMDMLFEEAKNPVTARIFVEIWALANRNAFASRVVDTIHNRERRAVRNLIRGLIPGAGDEKYDLRASMIVAQLEGLILFMAHMPADHPRRAGMEGEARESFLRLATEP